MQMDLNDPDDFTLENLRKVIASKDDSADRQLRITTDGIAYLSDDVAAENLDGLLFRFETWNKGNDYVGPAAAADDNHVLGVFAAMVENWPKPKCRHLDRY